MKSSKFPFKHIFKRKLKNKTWRYERVRAASFHFEHVFRNIMQSQSFNFHFKRNFTLNVISAQKQTRSVKQILFAKQCDRMLCGFGGSMYVRRRANPRHLPKNRLLIQWYVWMWVGQDMHEMSENSIKHIFWYVFYEVCSCCREKVVVNITSDANENAKNGLNATPGTLRFLNPQHYIHTKWYI